jgi:hypothetical protein
MNKPTNKRIWTEVRRERAGGQYIYLMHRKPGHVRYDTLLAPGWIVCVGEGANRVQIGGSLIEDSSEAIKRFWAAFDTLHAVQRSEDSQHAQDHEAEVLPDDPSLWVGGCAKPGVDYKA